MSADQHGVGYVLHARRYRENSRIVEVFTREHGRVSLLVRIGQKQAASALGKFQPFHECNLGWRGRAELRTLTSIEDLRGWRLAGLASVCGLYCNELLLKLLAKEQEMAAVYATYGDTLGRLASGAPPAPALRRFEAVLLEELGYGLHLDMDCVTGDALSAADSYYFHPGQGVSVSELGSGALAVSAAALHAIEARCFDDPGLARETRRVLGAAIAHLLNGRPLASKLLLQSMESQRA